MGRLARPAAGGITKYYWYPGERSDWIRAGLAAAAGAVTAILAGWLMASALWAAVLGTSVTTGVFGYGYGRKEARALQAFCRFGCGETARAGWRALVRGFGAAVAAVLVVHAARGAGILASWLLPVVPAIIGALAHQAGMLLERHGQARAEAATAVTPMAVVGRRTQRQPATAATSVALEKPAAVHDETAPVTVVDGAEQQSTEPIAGRAEPVGAGATGR